MTITVVKEHELMSYEALSVIDGLFFKFTNVKLNGPNKSIESSNYVCRKFSTRSFKHMR